MIRTIFDRILSYGLYPFVMFFSILLSSFLLESGYSIILSTIIPVILGNSIVLISEYILPYEPSWNPPLKTLMLDILYTGISFLVVSPIGKIIVEALKNKYPLYFFKIWPTYWSWPLQLFLAIFLADFGLYFVHKWMHLSPIGWKIHKIHHSATYLHLWTASRSHFLNMMITYMCEIQVLLFLGIPQKILVLWTVFVSLNGLFEHCNTNIKLGILNHLFVTSDVHRVHHSLEFNHLNKNFGNAVVIWDKIFGTFLLSEKPVIRVGIDGPSIPENYWEHFKIPFKS